jgi:hypothetical protein
MRRFAAAFGTGFREVKVGDEIRIHGRPYDHQRHPPIDISDLVLRSLDPVGE